FWKTLGPHIRKARAHQGTPSTPETPPPPPPPPPAELSAAKEPPPSPPAVAALSAAPVADSQAAAPTPAPPAPAEPSPAATQTAQVSARDEVDPQRLTVDVALGGGAFSRDFSYSADAAALGSYHLNVGPLVSGTLQVYPLARM